MPDFGIFRGFNDKLFGDKLYAGQLPINLGMIASDFVDSDAQAFFDRVTAAGGTLSATEQLAIDTLVKQMKSDGIWTKMKAIYPMVGASAAACAQNLKSSSFTGTFTATGWTFASTGVTPNGTNAFMNTNLIPDNSLTINNTHLSFYSRTNTVSGVDIGTNDNATTFLPLFKFVVRNSSNEFIALQYSFLTGEILTATNTDSRGFYEISRISNISSKAFKNGSSIVSSTTPNSQTRMSKFSLYIGASNNNGVAQEFSNHQCAFASIGDGLTDPEASNLYTTVQAFQTTLSRQV